MDKSVVREFWRKRAETGTTRWTGEHMLEYDRELLTPFVRADSAILDLGSGFGELSRSVVGAEGTLAAVDQEPSMGLAFRDDSRFEFVSSGVVDFVPASKFDLVLLFGVVTHLTETEENATYALIAGVLAPDAVAVIKNQCSDGDDFEVDTFSEHLGTAYVGRYPSVEHQLSRLARYFGRVDIIVYPDTLKMHGNTSHVAFVCQ
jgi:SAM-dependent methyltransferase